MTNPETGTWYEKAVLVEDSYYALLDKYGWPGPYTYHGPNKWTSDGVAYETVLLPFHLMKAGRVPTGLSGDRYENYLNYAGLTGDMWSGASADNGSGQPGGAFGYGIAHETALIASTSYGRHRAFALRCLTQ